MPTTLPQRLASGRAAQTGETPQQALDGLRTLDPGTPPIPDAATADQAFLESEFLELLGRCDWDRWRLRMLPFTVRSVTPRPHEVIIRIPGEFLPDVIREVMPSWVADEAVQDSPEVHGIAGLRARYDRGRGMATLHRPGFPGRIAIPAPLGLWRRAALVAADLCGDGSPVVLPWLSAPDDWHPCEARFAQPRPGSSSPGGWRYSHYGFGSQVMRRLPGLCPLPRAEWHSLWINHADIQLEWENGPAHAAVLERLLDPEFGPGAEVELLNGQSRADCYADKAGTVKARSARQPESLIALRRIVEPASARPSALTVKFGDYKRGRRDAAERIHGYRLARLP